MKCPSCGDPVSVERDGAGLFMGWFCQSCGDRFTLRALAAFAGCLRAMTMADKEFRRYAASACMTTESCESCPEKRTGPCPVPGILAAIKAARTLVAKAKGVSREH